MATSKKGNRNLSVTVESVWKGENEDDAEFSTELDQPPLLRETVLHQSEASEILQQNLLRLKELYRGQLVRLRYIFRERRRRFLQQWQSEGGQKSQLLDPAMISTPYDASVSGYGKANGEIGLLCRKRHFKRLRSTVEMLNSGQGSSTYSAHRHDNLVRLKHRAMKQHLCSRDSCSRPALPLISFCKQHITECNGQFLYAKCSFSGQDGKRCQNTISSHAQPPFCSEHAYHLMEGISSSKHSILKSTKNDEVKVEVKTEPLKVEVENEVEMEIGDDGNVATNDKVGVEIVNVSKMEVETVTTVTAEGATSESRRGAAPCEGSTGEKEEQPMKSGTTHPSLDAVESSSVEDIAGVISPVSTTDSTTCGSRGPDRLQGLVCSESEAESTDKEREC